MLEHHDEKDDRNGQMVTYMTQCQLYMLFNGTYGNSHLFSYFQVAESVNAAHGKYLTPPLRHLDYDFV